MRSFLTWSGAIVVVLSAGVAYDAVRATPVPRLAQSLTGVPTAVSTGSPRRPIKAGVLLQASDCTGNLGMLQTLNRRAVRDVIELGVLWYVGPASDSLVIRPLLPAFARKVPLQHATGALVNDLARLGHTSTPVLIVLDPANRIRLVTQSPRSSREVAGLRRIIEGLTWIEEF
jgi:hypothetical protein